MTTGDFIARALAVHGSRYDYSAVHYLGMRIKVSIVCVDHGEFTQSPRHHLRGQGCPECGLTTRAAMRRDDAKARFVPAAQTKHGADRYDYSKVEYVRSNVKVTITCVLHGDFQQRPASHLSGQGCPRCR